MSIGFVKDIPVCAGTMVSKRVADAGEGAASGVATSPGAANAGHGRQAAITGNTKTRGREYFENEDKLWPGSEEPREQQFFRVCKEFCF